MSHFHGIEPAAELIRAACAGESAAHEALYRIYQRPVYTLVRRLVARQAVADEVFQDVFVEILRNVSAYTATGSFSGWVRSIAVSKCLMYLRSPWHRSVSWLDADDRGSTLLVDPAVRLDAQAQANMDLTNALARLPAVSRSVVWLHDVEGYTHVEIARLLSRTPSFSKSQLARAHERLREWLGNRETSAEIPLDAPSLSAQILTD